RETARVELPAAEGTARTVGTGTLDAPNGEAARDPGADKPLLAATVLARDTQPDRAPDEEDTRSSRKGVRTVSASREGRGTAVRASGREEPTARVSAARAPTRRVPDSPEPAPPGMGILKLKVKGYFRHATIGSTRFGRDYEFNVSPGVHKVQLGGNDHVKPYSSPVTIVAGETTELHVTLEQADPLE
ncbi:hypothetical protein ACLESO_49380, partial [Pyxidicoccus sp. 3LG]